MSWPPTEATTPVSLAAVSVMNPGMRYVTMLAAIIKRNPARRYLAALLPLCKNLIMDGKLLKNYEVNCPYYKVICSFNKTLPYRQRPNRPPQASHLSTSPQKQ